MGNKAFVFDPKPYRIYPQKSLFSHVLGQTDDINEGISGIEKFYDEDLNNKEKIDSPLSLTLDSNLQYLIRKELIRAQQNFHNTGSGAILMNVENGEILSLVSLPDYDLNQRISITEGEPSFRWPVFAERWLKNTCLRYVGSITTLCANKNSRCHTSGANQRLLFF